MPFNRYRYIALLSGFLWLSSVWAQTEEDLLIERLVELSAEDLAEDVDLSELQEQMEFYRNNPIDLNRTDGSEMQDLRFIPQLFIDNLIAHRERSGKFASVYELQAIEGLDVELLRMLTPYVTVVLPRSLANTGAKQLLNEGKHDLSVRYGRTLQQRRGYAIEDTSRSRYLGSPDQVLTRYRYHFGRDLRIALNMKKDAGEAFFSGAQRYGFDFYSGSVHIHDQGRLRDMVVGDYALQFGQGLAMWGGMSFGKSSSLQNLARQATGLRPYTSSSEVMFLRGAAATVALGRLAVTPFLSWRRLDGSVSYTAAGEAVVGTINQTGLHRTPTEVANRGALQQHVYGLNVQYRAGRLQVGTTTYHTGFDATVQPQDLLRNRYAFRGRSLWNTSLYYKHSWRGLHVFGETAHSIGSGFAFANGLIASLHPHLSLALHYRNYQRDYHSFFNQGLAEGSTAANERGFYSGLMYHPNRKIEWTAYADFFRFPWLRYRVDGPSHGVDLLTQFTYIWYKKANVSVRYRYRQRQENAALGLPEQTVAGVLRQQLRISGQYTLNAAWSLRSRLEYAQYQKEGVAAEMGWMMYQDVIYKPMGSRFSGNMRFALFGIPGYNSRIYAYENNVLYANSFSVYHNDGIRTYLNIRCRIARKMDIWFRYAAFMYRGIDQIGSGLDAITGSRRSDVNVLLRCQF
ncbi:ComEA family DNA-binding protein [Parapedobacter deserti]|uniref:ComEA family DNA-binding protein n=1 Tax=Parapedobacter deserti TaxID=1912957 RepID=A0ABV7JIR2_9SPHI